MQDPSTAKKIDTSEKTFYWLFEASIIGKGIFAALDIIGGIFLYFVGPGFLANSVAILAQGELLEDPNDKFAQFFLQSTSHPSLDMSTFAVLYLFAHGIINAIFVIGLLYEKRWAFWFAVCAMSVFMLYQIYRLTLSFSPWLFVLTIFDICVIYLVWHEYRYRYGKK